MIGNKYERWTVIGEKHSVRRKQLCLCRCECGTERLVRVDDLLDGSSQSCGCLIRDRKHTEEERLRLIKAYTHTDSAKRLSVDRVARYRSTDKGKITHRKASSKYLGNNPEVSKAHSAVRYAILRGILVRKPCEVCGEVNSQAHHDNYKEKLSVRWLCVKHHSEHHSLSSSLLGE